MSLQGDYKHLPFTPKDVMKNLNSIIVTTPTGIKPEEMAALWPKGRQTKIIDRVNSQEGFFEVVDTKAEENGIVISFKRID